MKVLILGASGIVGQHMRLCVPGGVSPVWHRRQFDCLHSGADLCGPQEVNWFLSAHRPDVVVNLAGESSPDVVERNPQKYEYINARMPMDVAAWCKRHRARMIQISTQAVFSGGNPPYTADSPTGPVNEYGAQKAAAELGVRWWGGQVIRLTFVLGVRPFPHLGRSNPVEDMMKGQKLQVSDRLFSPVFASDAARIIWEEVLKPTAPVRNVGMAGGQSRHDIAVALGLDVEGCSHDSFEGIAPRPMDTSYADPIDGDLAGGLRKLKDQFESRQTITLRDKAIEVAMFLGMDWDTAYERLCRGFSACHQDVAEDFRRANPRTDADLLDWYKQTTAYIWELTAYHSNPGFNYAGMCRGIAERLRAAGVQRVLVLGDGVGTMTIHLTKAGFDATYHDLAGSQTQQFAAFRYWRQVGKEMPTLMTAGWEPDLAEGMFDAVVSCDFLEHVTDVPAWVAGIKRTMRPGGLLCAQNAFGIGSGENGSMPMHLARNDRFEKDWDPLLAATGFRQQSSNWYEVAA